MEPKQGRNRRPNSLLRQARVTRHWTQEQVAEQIGTSGQVVSNWERGIKSPSMTFRGPLCELFGMTLAELGIDREDVEENHPEVAEMPPQEPQTLQYEPADAAMKITPPRQVAIVDTNRQKMLQRTETIWITGVLHQSLYHKAALTLNLQEQPALLANPWAQEVQETILPSRLLPPGTSLVQIYEETPQKSLLLLGAPGAGKTTSLLILTEHLLHRAKQDEHQPIPIFLNLSSWGERRPQPLSEWVVESLKAKYSVPQEVGRAWVTQQHIILLLDGLDEVAETRRAACLEMIQRYHKEQDAVPLVLCSREIAYQELKQRIALQRAIVLQPLTTEQVDHFLAQAGTSLQAVREAVCTNSILRSLITTPFMLEVVDRAYYNASADDLLLTGSPQEQLRQIFATYVQRTLTHRGAHPYYTSDRIKQWLIWLAKQLAQQNQAEFYIERMRINLLPDKQSRQRYLLLLIRLIFGLQLIVSAGLFAWLRGGQRGNIEGVSIGIFGQLGSRPGNALLGWMAPGLGGGLAGGGSLGLLFGILSVLVILLLDRDNRPRLSWRNISRALRQSVRVGLLAGGCIGLLSGLLLSFAYGLVDGLYRGIAAGIFGGLLIAMITGFVTWLKPEQQFATELEETVILQKKWSTRILNMLFFSGCAILSGGMVETLLIGYLDLKIIVYSLVIGFYYGIAFTFGGGTQLIRGIGTSIQPAEKVEWSWKTVGKMAPSTIGTGLLVGLVVTGCGVVTLGAASSIFNGVAYGVRFGLVYGLILGFVSAVASILTGMLKSGWSSQIVAEDQLEKPNEGTHRSLKNALFAACLFGPLGGIASGLACGLAFGAVGQLAGWPILGLGFALVLGVVFVLDFIMLQGGIAYVQHYVLRWYLWRAGSLPWRYAAFLNDAVARMLLKKIWGGYRFEHLLLLEYLASLDPHATSEGHHPARHALAHGDSKTTPDWPLAISASLPNEPEHAAHER